MRHDAIAEKCEGPAPLRAIEKLIDHYDVCGLVFLLQRADRADADDVTNAEFLDPIKICPVVQLARQIPMTTPMPRQEDDFGLGYSSRKELVRRFTERLCPPRPTLPVNAPHLIQTAAADDSNS